MSLYEEEYYNSLNYTDYLGRKDKYYNSAKEMAGLLESIGLLRKESAILDYGCAVGFLARSLMELGYTDVYGYDISDWAVKEAEKNGIRMLADLDYTHSFELMFCLDVLEHMDVDSIFALFRWIQPKALIVRIPVSTNGGESFHLDVSNKDKTHISCFEKSEWIQILHTAGFVVFLPLHLLTIWDSEGVMCYLALRGNGTC